jgi:hypothetical protein
MTAADLTKGGWSKGLYEFDPALLIQTWCCAPCTVAEIHAHLGNDTFFGLSKPLACCVPLKPCQIFVYGQALAKKGGFEEKPIIGFAKLGPCCALCYLVQQYQECQTKHGLAKKEPADLLKSIGKPGQIEMM